MGPGPRNLFNVSIAPGLKPSLNSGSEQGLYPYSCGHLGGVTSGGCGADCAVGAGFGGGCLGFGCGAGRGGGNLTYAYAVVACTSTLYFMF